MVVGTAFDRYCRSYVDGVVLRGRYILPLVKSEENCAAEEQEEKETQKDDQKHENWRTESLGEPRELGGVSK